MWTIEKSFTFEAAHRLPNHDGKCARLHGHSYKMIVYIQSPTLIELGAESGMVMDYGDISDVVKPFIDQYLDHHYLNESTGLENPTSEELARWIYNRIKLRLNVYAVRVDETCTSSCLYTGAK